MQDVCEIGLGYGALIWMRMMLLTTLVGLPERM